MRSPSRLVCWFAATVGVIAMAVGSPAAAVSRFPPNMSSHLSLGYDPPCRVCHIQGTTGSGSVETPFGVSMHAHGLTSDRSTLNPALDALAAANVDSDGDGVPDIDELVADTDPNTPVDVPLSSSDPSYGCATAPAPTTARAADLPLLVALLGASVLLRRRRRNGASRSARR